MPSRSFNQSYDPELTGTRYPQSSMTFSGSTDAPASTIDGAPLVPGMGALAISHTPSSMLDGRVLPTPRTNSVTASVDGTSIASYTDTLNTSQTNKSAGSWITNRRTSCSSSQASTSTAPSSTAASLTGSCSRKSSSSSPRENQESSFVYISVPPAQSATSNAETSGPGFNLPPTNAAPNGIDDHLIYHSVVDGDGRDMMRTQSHRSGIYSYSTGTPKRASSGGSESTLLNGQAYQPFNQIHHTPSQQHQPLPNSLRHGSDDITAHNTPRNSLASLGSIIR
ncbi:MAG: hypothetical protein MMC23_005540 [Stictis urceolatum]|nr:hypothetical protein [Stictis urceolata]